jgi:LysR family transcriptional regulator, mexEF-oprN operon transcriptional activator
MAVERLAVIDHYNLRSFDLNLFLAFDAIMTELNVTRAAKRLRVRQPAMSHSLSALRVLFQDELFIRRGQTMEPTPYALHLAEPVRRVLAQAQDALTTRTTFDMLSEPRAFRIALSANLATVILPDLFAEIRAVAPRLRLAVREANQETISDMLRDGRSELGLGCFDVKHNWIRAETLFSERYVCCFNSELLGIGHRITFQDYFDLPHVAISAIDNPFGCLERAFAQLGRSPNVTMSVSYCFLAASAAARAPVLTTLPAALAPKYAAILGLTISPLPFDIETHPISMVWHSRSDRDDGVGWLRNRIKDVTAHGLKEAEANLNAHYLRRDIQFAEAPVLKLEARTTL